MAVMPAGSPDRQVMATDWGSVRKDQLFGLGENQQQAAMILAMFYDLREQWKVHFDYVIVDSRTGFNDVGGICTRVLPDFLVVVLSLNHQGLVGTEQVMRQVGDKSVFGFAIDKAVVASMVPDGFDDLRQKRLTAISKALDRAGEQILEIPVVERLLVEEVPFLHHLPNTSFDRLQPAYQSLVRRLRSANKLDVEYRYEGAREALHRQRDIGPARDLLRVLSELPTAVPFERLLQTMGKTVSLFQEVSSTLSWLGEDPHRDLVVQVLRHTLQPLPPEARTTYPKLVAQLQLQLAFFFAVVPLAPLIRADRRESRRNEGLVSSTIATSPTNELVSPPMPSTSLVRESRDFMEAISLYRDSIGLLKPEDPGWEEAQTALTATSLRYSELERDESVLIDTATFLEDELARARRGSPAWATTQANLGAVFFARFEASGRLAELSAALHRLDASLKATPQDSPAREPRMTNRAAIALRRYEQTGHARDLNRVVDVMEKLVNDTPTDSPERLVRLSNLGAALFRRFEALGSTGDLDATIKAFQEATEKSKRGTLDWLGRTLNLAAALRKRGETNYERRDLDSAIGLLQGAISGEPNGSLIWHTVQPGLGAALAARYYIFGRMDDLDTSINAFTAAAGATAHGSRQMAVVESNLGIALRSRFEVQRRRQDIDAAIDRLIEGIEATSPESPDGPRMQANLSHALLARYDAYSDERDLEKAVAATATALKATRRASPDRAPIQTLRGNLLLRRFRRTNQRKDLDAAIDAYKDATTFCPPGGVDWIETQANLASALRERAGASNRAEDAVQAASLFRVAVEATLRLETEAIRIRTAKRLAPGLPDELRVLLSDQLSPTGPK